MSSENDYSVQSSLTSPADKNETDPKSYNLAASLTEEEVKHAMSELSVKDFVNKFPRFEKFYADPKYENQVHCLVSFFPAKGAKPDEDGVYGMLKVRGTFATQDEADLKAESLIRNVDSFHSIYHTYVGRPFPLAATKKYICETKDIDIKKKVVETTSEEVRKKREEEKQAMEEIKEREAELLKDVGKSEIDPQDRYIELMVKKSQLTWTYNETMKKMNEMRTNIIKSRSELAELRAQNEDYHTQFFDRYMEARKKSGLPDDDNSFIKYMCEDLDLGF
jgi:hypothetical protein